MDRTDVLSSVADFLAAPLFTLGMNLATLFAAGAVLAVAVGFAIQNIAHNFVSGLILLVERSIQPGDVLEVDGEVVRVVDMRIRSTVARSRDEEEFVVPNSALVQSTVKNFTLRDDKLRIRHEAIWRSLQEAGVTIAFPRRDVHFDPEALEAWGGSGRRGGAGDGS